MIFKKCPHINPDASPTPHNHLPRLGTPEEEQRPSTSTIYTFARSQAGHLREISSDQEAYLGFINICWAFSVRFTCIAVLRLDHISEMSPDQSFNGFKGKDLLTNKMDKHYLRKNILTLLCTYFHWV